MLFKVQDYKDHLQSNLIRPLSWLVVKKIYCEVNISANHVMYGER